jgi:hypothetical protein
VIDIEDVFSNPQVLQGTIPDEVHQLLQNAPNWRLEQLRRGSHVGQGFVFREYTARGDPTGRVIQWHPGGGHHGPLPYWKVSSGRGGVVRVGPQFP